MSDRGSVPIDRLAFSGEKPHPVARCGDLAGSHRWSKERHEQSGQAYLSFHVPPERKTDGAERLFDSTSYTLKVRLVALRRDNVPQLLGERRKSRAGSRQFVREPDEKVAVHAREKFVVTARLKDRPK